MHANTHSYKNRRYIQQCSENVLKGKEETFSREIKCLYCIDTPFWSTAHDWSSQTKHLLYNNHLAVCPMKSENLAELLYLTESTVKYNITTPYKVVKCFVKLFFKIN